jgi:Kdo2-lipid IVA lauroyltransferase/acyltransferase
MVQYYGDNELDDMKNGSEKTEKTENDQRGFERSELSLFTKFKYMFVRGSLLLIVKLAGLDGLYRFGELFGSIEFGLQYRKRFRLYRRVEEVLQGPVPLSKKWHIVRRQMCRVRCDKMIYTIMDRIDRKELLGRFEITNRQYMDEAVAQGQGTFFMFSHQGSHHLGGILLTLSGYPIIGLRDPNESPLRLYVQEQFERNFPEFKDLQITASDSFARTFFHAFKKNSIVAAAMDVWRDRGGRTAKVQIFGQEREFLSGMTYIALRSHSPVVVGFMLSLPHYHYRLIFHPWLSDPEKDQDTPDTVQRVMQQYAQTIENHVKEHPCHISKTH